MKQATDKNLKMFDETLFAQYLIKKFDDEHLKCVIENHLTWYVIKAKSNKICYLTFSVLALLCTSIIPVINLFGAISIKSIVTTGLSAITGISIGLLSLLRFRDNWDRYRRSAEAIKEECILFLSKTGPYDVPDADKIFIKKIETISFNEINLWKNTKSES